MTQWLYPNAADAELHNASSYPVDFVSNGFKIRTGAASYGLTQVQKITSIWHLQKTHLLLLLLYRLRLDKKVYYYSKSLV
jgi:hypothetical protein